MGERAKGMHILSTHPPDGPPQMRGGMANNASGRNTARSRRSGAASARSYRQNNDPQLNLSIGAPPSVSERFQTNYDMDQQVAANKRDASHRSVYDADQYSVAESQPRYSARSGRSQGMYSARSGVSGSMVSGDEDLDYTTSLGLIGSKAKPDPGQPYLLGAGSPTKAHVIESAYARYEGDIKRRQGNADRLDKEAQDRQRLQQQVEILKAEQKRREQQEMKRMLAKQVVERQKKREEERCEKLVPYDLTHVLPLERDRDFFQEYAEKQGMKRALFKQMEEKKNIKQRELDM